MYYVFSMFFILLFILICVLLFNSIMLVMEKRKAMEAEDMMIFHSWHRSEVQRIQELCNNNPIPSVLTRLQKDGAMHLDKANKYSNILNKHGSIKDISKRKERLRRKRWEKVKKCFEPRGETYRI